MFLKHGVAILHTCESQMRVFKLLQCALLKPFRFVEDMNSCVIPLMSTILPHPSWGFVLLRSEIPSGMCAKLRTVAASNNRDHARNLSYYCLLALHI